MLIILEREKLYEEVWDIKMKELAKTYGISEATLRKHCRTLNVPIPQSGYWMKVRNGSITKKIALPKFEGENKIVIQKYNYGKVNNYTENDRLKHMSEEEKDKLLNFCNGLKVPERLYKPHSIIKEAIIYRNDRDMIRDGRASNMNVKVSEENKNRAFRIFDTILKSIEALGYKIKSERKDTRVCIGGEEVKIGLKEKLVRIDHVKNDKDSYWRSVYDYKYSGELSLFIDEYNATKKNWRDLQNKNLEEMIGEFIISIIDTAEGLKALRVQREKGAERHRQEEIDHIKLKNKQEYEMKKVKELSECAENYRISIAIDEYISALEEHVEEGLKDQNREKINEYIDWARRKSEWLNPLKRRMDEVLGNKYNEEMYDIDFEDDEDDNYWWVR